MKPFLTYTLSCVFTLSLHAYSFQDQTGYLNVPYLEWAIEWDGAEGNPYDVIAHALFTHEPGGETIDTLMFYDGGNTWKFRFTGTQTGVWTFKTKGPGALGGKTGNVDIKDNPAGKANGFLTHFGNKWGWSGTQKAFIPQLVMYRDPSELYHQPDQIDRDIQLFFGEHGFNGFHTVVLTRWFGLNQINSGGIASESPNPDSRTLEALEPLILKAYAAGGMVHIWAWGDEQRRQTPAKWGLNGEADRRLQRMIAARLGPLPGWSIGYGFDLDEWVKEDDLRRWHTYMHECLGWHHFLGGRSRGPNHGTDHDGYQIYEGLDYAGYEHHRPTYEVYVAALKKNPDKPVMSEDRFRIRNPSRYPEKDYDEEMTRRGLWDSAMAGGVANIWGRLTGGPAYHNKHWIKTYARFFENRFLKTMIRGNARTDGVCLQTPDTRHLIVYKKDAASIQIDLTGIEPPIKAVAVDAKRPYQEIELPGLKAGKQEWTVPYPSDWAIAVGTFDE